MQKMGMETREPCSEQRILHDPAESCPAAVRYAMGCLDWTTTLCVIMCYHTASEQNYALLATKERWNIPLSPPIITDCNAIWRWEYMGLRCDDIKLCVGNCHLHIADAVSHVSPKTVATKSLLRISGQKWQLLELFTIRMLEIFFRALSQQVHILYKLGGPQSQCSLQNTTYKRFDTICKGSWFLQTNTIIYNTCYTNIMWHHRVSDQLQTSPPCSSHHLTLILRFLASAKVLEALQGASAPAPVPKKL